ncbi:PduL/EutD family phosphate acyltransferase [Sinanaerobacter chloroacetimidivorans]|uniref:Phosphate propanoyltransferase n=1 Tax=Sinanaerobacter chloroacetimidivorans TaxID=2818044 RepID=A0A8J7VZY4_9FIRM|nr:PduL/EutD family phosphate acyltransferase [Sinanaerobacter chloroacetimidivorans]MBR0597816.1 propanediol utilization protein [Sinanaerobacter chloroacetimidivorans]
MKTAYIMISNRHIHLTREAVDVLFGKDYELTVKKPLGYPIFAANETVTLKGPKGTISNVRVLGPMRPYNQAEILTADNFVLGINAPVKLSGSPDLAPLTIIGPAGELKLESVAVIAKRHIHMSPEKAAEYGLENKQLVRVKIAGERALIFDETVVTFTDIPDPTMHIDVEEGNAAHIKNMDIVEILP